MSIVDRASRKPRREVVQHSSLSAYTFKDETVGTGGFGWHFHSEVELNLVLRGKGMRYVGDSIEPFSDGDLVLIGPNVPHACPKPAPGETLRTLVIQFPMAFYEDTFSELPDFRSVGRLLDRSRQGLKFQGPGRAKAAGLMEEMVRLPVGSRRGGRLLELLGVLAEETEGRVLTQGPVRLPDVNPSDKRIQSVFDLIQESLPEVLSEGALSAKLGMSPGGFSHFFRRSMGKSYLDYVGELRVGLACKALVETDKPVVEVAWESGFNNMSNFHRQFKKLKGMTPMAFRRLSDRESGCPAEAP